MKVLLVACGVGILSASVVIAKKTAKVEKVFYVYSDKSDKRNHFAPSGWMGDYGDLKLNDADTESPIDGRTAVKWVYNAKGAQGANWAGVYWQQPPNNWGDKPGGYDLTGFKKLTFWAKGQSGNEKISEFKVGGITGEHGDSDSNNIGPIQLSREWKRYEIDLKGKNLTNIVGAFCWAASRDDNPQGFTFYLDEIRFE
jgi:hypothetical protein